MVVALEQVIEFVNKTTSFGSFVVSGPRHKAYFPDEWTCLKCHQHYDTVDRRKSSVDTMRKNLEEIFDKFSPSYRFFFLEVFGSNVEFWHTAKMNFTRSVAVSSIVGHILGIGDRHTSNILVHRGTGECLQIDFGIVFEQGKTLQVPEQVPFRLTRDMVDGKFSHFSIWGRKGFICSKEIKQACKEPWGSFGFIISLPMSCVRELGPGCRWKEFIHLY